MTPSSDPTSWASVSTGARLLRVATLVIFWLLVLNWCSILGNDLYHAWNEPWLAKMLHSEWTDPSGRVRSSSFWNHAGASLAVIYAAMAYLAVRIDWWRVMRPVRRSRAGDFSKYLLRERFYTRWARRLMGAVLLPVAGMIGAVANDAGRHVSNAGDALATTVLAGIIASLPVVVLGRTGLRLLVQRGETALRRDRREPILYLRSFRSDASTFDRFSAWFWALFFGARPTAEHALSTALRDMGPLVAIGRPSEKLPPLGASRLYVQGKDWQRVVEQLVAVARLIVVRVGPTPGFEWEIRHLLEHCDPRRVVIYVPKCDRRAYRQWRARGSEMFRVSLPEVRRQGLICFTSDWQPSFLPLRSSPWTFLRGLAIGSMAIKLRKAFGEALRPLRMQPGPLPPLPQEWILIAGATAQLFLTILTSRY